MESDGAADGVEGNEGDREGGLGRREFVEGACEGGLGMTALDFRRRRSRAQWKTGFPLRSVAGHQQGYSFRRGRMGGEDGDGSLEGARCGRRMRTAA